MMIDWTRKSVESIRQLDDATLDHMEIFFIGYLCCIDMDNNTWREGTVKKITKCGLFYEDKNKKTPSFVFWKNVSDVYVSPAEEEL